MIMNISLEMSVSMVISKCALKFHQNMKESGIILAWRMEYSEFSMKKIKMIYQSNAADLMILFLFDNFVSINDLSIKLLII